MNQTRVFRVGRLCIPVFLFALSFPTHGQTHPHGTVTGQTYSDPRFGLVYNFPTGLEVQYSFNGMRVGTGEKTGVSEFLFSAMAPPDGKVRSGVFIVSDPRSAFISPDPAIYLRQTIAASMKPTAPFDIQSVEIAGRTFVRASVGIDGPVHIFGAQFATQCGTHFVSFYFSGTSPVRVEKLVHSLDDLQLSCPSGS